ncbi:MAG: deoxyuridine 5-triphosphate nucleotidohydrolase Dut [Firmicutes bacterium]|nr:deoxyuridine 5-triphosphate nucleotidohydrolase Dut [Bacillota bacterium]
MRKRGFEVVRAYTEHGINLPERKTAYSAGYDIMAADNAVLEPGTVTIVPTGLKAYMPEDEYLAIHIRSGLSIKNMLSLINSQGIIDADYYNNSGNEGHILVAIFNHGPVPVSITKGDRIAQGVFSKYLTVDYEAANKHHITRTGGIGSTGK